MVQFGFTKPSAAVSAALSASPSRAGPTVSAVCHCLDCRKHHGVVFYAAAIFPAGAVVVAGETGEYWGRHFCPRCGSSVFARVR